jgi:hypothetical protein
MRDAMRIIRDGVLMVACASRTLAPGVYLATVILDYNGIFKEVGAGTIEIR